MEAERRSDDVGLIPGLPEELALAHVLPRLPWYVRPVCRAISKSWRACIDSCRWRPELELATRTCQLPLLRGLFLICTFDGQVFITRGPVTFEKPRPTCYTVQQGDSTYQIHSQWRKLSPLLGLLPSPPEFPRLVASSGMVYVWLGEGQDPNVALKMDLGRGDWYWNKFPVPRHLDEYSVDFNGKIFIPQAFVAGLAGQEKEAVLVYDMMTDQCEQIQAWNHSNLRVLLKKNSHLEPYNEEELYSFVEHNQALNPRLELAVYDACSYSWTTQEEMPFPEWMWPELLDVKLLNGDCFEPTSTMNANTVWVDVEDQVITWFDSLSVDKSWVGIDYNFFLKDMYMEYAQFIRGSLYGIFCSEGEDNGDKQEEDKNVQEEDAEGLEDPRLNKRTIMKGRICVTSNIVEWEAVHEIGRFEDAGYSPIECFTVMG